MRLHDSIEVLDAQGNVVSELPCHISMDKTQAEIDLDIGQQYVLTEIMSVILLPTEYATPGRRWRWRERDYIQRADPRVRRRKGKDHHYTIELTRG